MAVEITSELRRTILSVAVAAENDLSAELNVAAMASAAGLSEKHFQRLFKRVCGEPPKRYLRRIRLQGAAYLLRWSQTPVTQIGLDAGFVTAAGFNKAFARVYGCGPQEFRDRQDTAPYLRRLDKPIADRASAADVYESIRLSVRLNETPSRRIAFHRYIGPVEGMADAWSEFVPWLRRYGLLNEDAVLLGVYHDYWDQGSADQYRYDAAVVVPHDFSSDEPVNTRFLPATLTAMTEFTGSLTEADNAWRRLIDQWLPASGYRPSAAYAYDHYPPDLFDSGVLARVRTTLSGIRATLCLPVAE